MATQNLGVTRSYEAGEDLSSSQYYLVYLSADGVVKTPSSANAKVVGVLQNEPESGETAVVAMTGVSKFMGGESCSLGKLITSDNAGKGEVADAAGEYCVGVCVKDPGGDGQIGEVLLGPLEAHDSDA